MFFLYVWLGPIFSQYDLMNPLILNDDKNRMNLSEFDQNDDNKSVGVTHNQGNTSTKSTETNQIMSKEKNEWISEACVSTILHSLGCAWAGW